MPEVFHITPHLGGGVGSVLLNYFKFDKTNSHTVATLDYANEKSLEMARQCGFGLISQPNKEDIFEFIEESDVTVVHFWNHPLLYDFLLNNELPKSRLIFWSHISGFEPPYVFTQNMLNYPDKFVFTTPLSFNTREVLEFENKEKLASILSTGGVKDVKLLPHDGFNVGYVGTVDFAKMHPEYVEVHKKIKNAKFIIVGGDKEEEISKTADERFEFVGKVSDIVPHLSKMDVFGYLLNEKHYGTAEQVLQEAMAAGVVPVVLNNPTEAMLVEHNKTGLVAKNLDEYVEYIELLHDDEELRKTLSQNAKQHALNAFSLENLVLEWSKIYDEVLKFEKIPHGENQNLAPYEVFLESLGKHKEPFMLYLNNGLSLKETLSLPQWQSETKGTPKQYYSFFNNDEKLEEICRSYE